MFLFIVSQFIRQLMVLSERALKHFSLGCKIIDIKLFLQPASTIAVSVKQYGNSLSFNKEQYLQFVCEFCEAQSKCKKL